MARYSQTFAHIGRMKRAAGMRRRQERMTMEPETLDTLIRRLILIAAHQDRITENQRAITLELRAFNAQQVAINAQQVAINTDVNTTLARIETLLARVIAQGDN